MISALLSLAITSEQVEDLLVCKHLPLRQFVFPLHFYPFAATGNQFYLDLSKALLQEAREYDLASIDDAVDDEALREEILQAFLEKRLDRKLTPEIISAINVTIHFPR